MACDGAVVFGNGGGAILSPLVALPVGIYIALRVIVDGIRRKLGRRIDRGTGLLSVTTNINGKRYRVTSDDEYIIQVEGEFEPDLVRLLTSLIEPTDTALDIGANIGCTSILFGSVAQRVFSFEPSPSTFAFLQKNLAASGLKNVELINRGLGSSDGSFELTFSPQNRSGGFVSNQVTASEGHRVETITIVNGDRFLAEHGVSHVDFIKIDVEGFEREVLTGLSATIARDKPTVVLELNHWTLNAFQRITVPDFLDFLRNMFPILYAVEDGDVRNLRHQDDTYHVLYEHIVNGFKYPTLVAAFDERRLRKFATSYQLSGKDSRSNI